mmetsp:Transcript_3834/g.11127  ORF Transcript_3834/g.11127 Transcript_3834/m.11127 type:complete len:201 (-) Transcript_3834:499-1101(-)
MAPWPFGSRASEAEGATLVDPELGDASGTADSGRGSFFSLPSFSTASNEEGPSTEENLGLCGELSYKTRLYGFLICFALGSFMSISSSFFVGMIVIKPSKFALPYTMGNILSLGSSAFFVGPTRFCSTMFNENRRVASAIYLATLFLTLVAALYLHSGFLTFVCVVVQFGSYLWLMASYIPFGRRMLQGVAGRATSLVMS